MEVVSLGLLALASSAFLTKAKVDSKKKKEAFADSLFGEVPGRKLTTESQKFITDSASLFNPLAALLNPSKTKFSAAADGSMAAYNPPTLETSANLFRSIFTKPSISGTDTIDDKRSEKSATIYRVPKGSVLTEAVNICETKQPIKNADGTANCALFDDSTFSATCGICHRNSENSDGKNNNATQGLYVTGRMKQEPTEQELQRRMLAETNPNLSQNFIKPTVGKCGSDTKTNKNYFSLSKGVCEATNKFLKCKEGQDFTSSEGCYACRRNITGGSSFNFVNSNVGLFSVRQPTTFTLGGKGKVKIQLYDENGSTPLGYLYGRDSEGFLTLSSNSNDLTLIETPPKYKIPLTSSGEAAAGKYLVITLSKVNSSDSVPYVQGNFYGELRGQESSDKTDFAQTALDITSLVTNITPLTGNNGSFIYYRNANDTNGMQMQPSINVDTGQQNVSATFKVLIPYLYIDKNNIEATYCDGPFIKNSNSSALLSNNPCFSPGSGPGSYNSNCLSNIFITAGCSNAGSNFPGNADAIARLNAMGDKRTISSNINSLFNAAYSGYSNGQLMSDTNLLDAQRACFDKLIVDRNPCLNLSEYVQSNGPLNEQCIKYLYASGRTNDTTNREAHDPQTYSGSNAASLFNNRKKDRYCTEKGTISPLDGSSGKAANIELAKTKGGVAALKSFYDNIHMMANKTHLTNAERAEYVLKCYGTTLDVQADSNPVDNNGQNVAATNCGSGGLATIGNIRYVKIFGASGKKLMLSQVAVLDARGQNVALGKKVEGAAASSGSLASIVDGKFSLKTSPYISSSNGNGALDNNLASISIDLDGQYDIVQIIVFNTSVYGEQIGLSGAKAAIYDNNNGYKAEYTLTAAPVQYIDIIGASPSKSCPQLISGKRGDLLSGTESVANNIALNEAALSGSVTYTKYDSGSGGIDINGGAVSSSPEASWIWNHSYASVNGGSTTAKFYTIVDNTSKKQASYTICYRMNNGSVSATLNSAPLTLPTSGNSVTVKFVPGDNLITFTCTPSTATSPTAFAALVKDYGGTVKRKTNSSGDDWFCYTQPSMAGINSTKTAVGTIYKIYDTPTGSWYDDDTNNNYVKDTYGPGANIDTAKWIWNQPEAALAPGSADAKFYYDFTGSAGEGITYKLYFNKKGTISIIINGKDYSASLTGFEFKAFSGQNRISITVTPSSGSGGFIAYLTNSSGTVANSQTGVSGSLWKCDGATTWSAANPCALVDTGNMTYNCAKNKFAAVGCTQTLSVSDYKNKFYDKYAYRDITQEIRNNWFARTASSGAQQTACRGRAVCPTGSTYDSVNERCWVPPTDTRTGTYDNGTWSYSYDAIYAGLYFPPAIVKDNTVLSQVKYIFVYHRNLYSPFQIARLRIVGTDDRELTGSSILDPNNIDRNLYNSLNASIIPSFDILPRWDIECVNCPAGVLNSIIDPQKPLESKNQMSGSLYTSKSMPTGFFIQFDNPVNIRYVEAYGGGGHIDSVQRFTSVQFYFYNKDYQLILDKKIPFFNSYRTNITYGKFYMTQYKDCESGYTFNANNIKCEKTVGTTPPQF